MWGGSVCVCGGGGRGWERDYGRLVQVHTRLSDPLSPSPHSLISRHSNTFFYKFYTWVGNEANPPPPKNNHIYYAGTISSIIG